MEKHGTLLGVPYDFRKPTWKRMKKRVWNPDDARIFTSRSVGIGWDINFYQLKKRYPPLFYVLVVAITVGLAHRIWKFFTQDDED